MAEANKKDKKENFFVRTGKRIAKWFREMKSELKKVVWPTKKQVLNSVIVTLVCVLIVGIFIWVFDAAAGFAIDGIISLVGN